MRSLSRKLNTTARELCRLSNFCDAKLIINHANDYTTLHFKNIGFKFVSRLFLVVYRPAWRLIHSRIIIRHCYKQTYVARRLEIPSKIILFHGKKVTSKFYPIHFLPSDVRQMNYLSTERYKVVLYNFIL